MWGRFNGPPGRGKNDMNAFRKTQLPDSHESSRTQFRDLEWVASDRTESSLTWEQVARVLQKRKRTFLLVAGGITILAAVAAFAMRDVYRPVARLEIDPVGAG